MLDCWPPWDERERGKERKSERGKRQIAYVTMKPLTFDTGRQ